MDNLSSQELATQIKWSRFINIHGKAGYNVPVDLHMEHLNKQLKRLVTGLGANCTASAMVAISKCIKNLQEVTSTIDQALNIAPDQIHHSKRSSEVDEKLIMSELVDKSQVFEYCPGRLHQTFRNTSCSILQSLNADKFITWLQSQKKKVLDEQRYKKTLQ